MAIAIEKVSKRFRFQSKLERLAPGIEYFAVSVPEHITRKLGTRAALPVLAVVNGSKPFRGSLYTVGNGRHGIRIKASVRKEVGLNEGDLVEVVFEIVDRAKEDIIPVDLMKALKSKSLVKKFNSIPPGKKSFLLRKLDEAVKKETRLKRLDEILKTAAARK